MSQFTRKGDAAERRRVQATEGGRQTEGRGEGGAAGLRFALDFSFNDGTKNCMKSTALKT